MGLHTDGVLVLFFVGCVMMNMRVVINQIHTLRHIEELQVRSVVCQLVSPSLLETDIADAEVSLTACKLYELLRRRVIGFRTCALGHHADYRKAVAGNGFGEVPQRLEGNGDNRFSFAPIVGFASGFAGSYQYSCK